VTRNVLSPAMKSLGKNRDLNKASMLLLVDDAASLEKNILAEEKSLLGTAVEIGPMEKNTTGKGSVIKKNNTRKKYSNEELESWARERVEDAIEDLILQSLERKGSLFERSVHELLNEPKFSNVAVYLRDKHKFILHRKIDLFLLLNESKVENLQLDKQEVSYILMQFSDIYTARAIGYLLIDLSEHQKACDRLNSYTAKRNLQKFVQLARNDMLKNMAAVQDK